MHLIVIRHGETLMNIDGRLQGSKGPNEPLTTHGVEQITRLRDALLVTPTSIFASPLLRTQQSAAILNERFLVPIVTRPELMERDFGSLSGALKSTIDPQLMEDDLEGHYDYRPYGGESVEDVKRRVLAFLSGLPLATDETVLVLTHRGVIRVLYDLFPTQVHPEEVLPATVHSFLITALPLLETN
jgi:probable phosphoglycerate mutase